MQFLTLSVCALLADKVWGFMDTSPFFLFSTSPNFGSDSTTQIQKASDISERILQELSSCSSENYIIIKQSGVSTADYADSDNTPALASIVRRSRKGIKSSIVASEVLGNIDTESWEEYIHKQCNAPKIEIEASKQQDLTLSASTKLYIISFPAPSPPLRLTGLAENDAFFELVMGLLSSSNFTILYTTTTPTLRGPITDQSEGGRQYRMEPPLFDIPQSELKRDLSKARRQDDSTNNSTLVDGPLFDRYQFFTPAVWMSLVATLLLLLVLYIGLSGLLSLQVTYAAFEKESGPSSAKKAQ